MAAGDADVRQGALRQILLSVDRTTRLVRQLLTLAKIDAGLEANQEERVCVGTVLKEVLGPAQPEPKPVHVGIS